MCIYISLIVPFNLFNLYILQYYIHCASNVVTKTRRGGLLSTLVLSIFDIIFYA